MNPLILNFILFQIGWFACVLSGASNQAWIGVSIAGFIIAFHLFRAQQKQKELWLISSAMVIGAIWDSLLVYQGWLSYTSGTLIAHTAPYWIIVMWGLFATTLNLSLRWLKGKTQLAIVFGAIAGPLAYYAGQKLGAVQFVEPVPAFIALAIGWAIFTPLLLFLSSRFNGYQITEHRSPSWTG